MIEILCYRCLKMKLYNLCVVLWVLATVTWRPVLSTGTKKYSETEASHYLENANAVLAQWTNRVIHANWDWLTNLTNENAKKKVPIHYLL